MFKLFVKKTYNTFLCSMKRKISKEDFVTKLNRGIEIELKHFNNKAVAKDVATDNLYENPNYYNK